MLTRIFIWGWYPLMFLLLLIQTREIIKFSGDNETRAVVGIQEDTSIFQAVLHREGEEAQK